MKIYKLYLEAFRDSYKGYWASLESAVDNLHSHEDFLKVVRWNINIKYHNSDKGMYSAPDQNLLYSLRPVVKIGKGKDTLEVSMPGLRINRTAIKEVPEIKVPGQPYQPAKRITEDLDPLILGDEVIAIIYGDEIIVNS
jgi:hypothetical protein